MDGGKRGGRTAREHIVLVDNDPIMLEVIGELLRSKGYEVHPARDGLEGLQAIRKLTPTYVLLDIVLPKIDGSRVCWLVRQDPRLRNTLIIALSGLSPEQIRRFPELSADAYVAKGPLAIVANNLILAISYLKEKGGGSFEGGIFGYEGYAHFRLRCVAVGRGRPNPHGEHAGLQDPGKEGESSDRREAVFVHSSPGSTGGQRGHGRTQEGQPAGDTPGNRVPLGP